jgi:hypothetical protein
MHLTSAVICDVVMKTKKLLNRDIPGVGPFLVGALGLLLARAPSGLAATASVSIEDYLFSPSAAASNSVTFVDPNASGSANFYGVKRLPNP